MRGLLPFVCFFCDREEGCSLPSLSFNFRRDEGLLPFVRIFFYFHDEAAVASSCAFSSFRPDEGHCPSSLFSLFQRDEGASASSLFLYEFCIYIDKYNLRDSYLPRPAMALSSKLYGDVDVTGRKVGLDEVWGHVSIPSVF